MRGWQLNYFFVYHFLGVQFKNCSTHFVFNAFLWNVWLLRTVCFSCKFIIIIIIVAIVVVTVIIFLELISLHFFKALLVREFVKISIIESIFRFGYYFTIVLLYANSSLIINTTLTLIYTPVYRTQILQTNIHTFPQRIKCENYF